MKINNLCVVFIIMISCSHAMEKQAVDAKEAANKALAEAKSAESLRTTKFTNLDEKLKAIREKALSALNNAQTAIGLCEGITTDAKQSDESKRAAHEAKNVAEQAIHLAGSTLATNPSQ